MMHTLWSPITERKGFALTELIVVLSIMAVLLTIGTINFGTWQKKHYIESQVKEMAADFSEVRLMAMRMKQRHLVTLNPNQYTFRSFSSEGDAAGTEVKRKNLSYQITRTDGSSLAGVTFVISERGFLEALPPPVIAVGFGVAEPGVNCISISTGRVNMGKLNGTSCEFK